ncbi:hypothetical protein IC229_23245 [Spirosoma sp. BT702]|uniref:Uncharacterized protein n=1 Tax=Spirosoma profusum TaxID=2771354 RepID=A0A926XYZ5_9BACT|nr:hypothetical protein [Spirosoma profusum]MBD2703579.1 hypothetical protein [Spirosoma profusum]
MESINLPSLSPAHSSTRAIRASRRRVDGAATASLLIQMASEILAASPTLRKRVNVSLADLAAAEKVRRELARKSSVIQ